LCCRDGNQNAGQKNSDDFHPRIVSGAADVVSLDLRTSLDDRERISCVDRRAFRDQ
jgi:hypothetical protein